MTLSVQPTDATLGAIITGVELARLDAREWRLIESAFNEHALLIFPGQHLQAGDQLEFAARFGEFEEMEPNKPTLALGNRDERGERLPERSDRVLFSRGNERWHTDSSYMPLSAKASVVSAEQVPDDTAGTEWADARAGYDALDEVTRQCIETLNAYHSYAYSQGQLGHKVAVGSAYGFFEGELPLHPLVKIHPVTGRPALFVGRHAYRIPGMGDAQAQRLARELTEFVCQPPRLYRHRWTVGDVVVWDNRCLLHRAEPYDDAAPRRLQHTRISGDPASELALNYR